MLSQIWWHRIWIYLIAAAKLFLMKPKWNRMFLSQQHLSSPAQSTDRSLCPPPPCTRVGSARQQAPRMEAQRTACPLDVTASQDTQTALWLRQDTPTLSTLASATASHHRFVSTSFIKIQHRNICRNTQTCKYLHTCTCTYTHTHKFCLKQTHTHLSTHICYHTKERDTNRSSWRSWNAPYGRIMIHTRSSVCNLGGVIAVTLMKTLLG